MEVRVASHQLSFSLLSAFFIGTKHKLLKKYLGEVFIMIRLAQDNKVKPRIEWFALHIGALEK